MIPSTMRKMTSSTMKVPFGMRKLLVPGAVRRRGRGTRVKHAAVPPRYFLARTKTNRAMKTRLMKYIASHETHDDEHDREQPTLRLGLAGDAGDRLAAGQAVADRCADGAAAECEAAADHGAGQLDRLVEVICHLGLLLPF